MGTHSPLCGENVGVIDPVNGCLLQQKRESHFGREPCFDCKMWGLQARFVLECRAHRLALSFKHELLRLVFVLKCEAIHAYILMLKQILRFAY